MHPDRRHAPRAHFRHTPRAFFSLVALGALVACTLATPADAEAQERWRDRFDRGRRGSILDNLPANIPYNGGLTFLRIRFEPGGSSGDSRRGRWGWGDPGWAHDYPDAERNLMRVMDDLTTIRLYRDGGNIVELDDPALFKYPIAYVSEPGGWVPTDEEVANLRAYIKKGGFVIFDDFDGRDWYNFARQMRRVLPDAELIPLDVTHPVFNSFFRIESLDALEAGSRTRGSEYYGIFEKNDPTARLMVVVNYNNDIGDYWEYAHTGFMPIDISNEALKLGVNYFIYALTH